jgi:hypothetical protein
MAPTNAPTTPAMTIVRNVSTYCTSIVRNMAKVLIDEGYRAPVPQS